MSAKAQKLAAKYGKLLSVIDMYKEVYGEKYHVSAFTNPVCPVITDNPQIQLFQWGLIPSWVQSSNEAEEIRRMTYNAKSETVFEKSSFSHAITHGRCIIPSTGYFEWRHEGSRKIPYFIFVKDADIFSMAGISETWVNKETKESVTTFSIITTTANSLTEYIHNTKKRMPLILNQKDEQKWITPNLLHDEVIAMMQPFDTTQMDAYTINTNFIKLSPYDPNTIQKVEQYQQGSLF